MTDDPRLKPLVDETLPPVGLRMTASEREDWGQERPPRAPTLNPGDVCAGVGKPSVVIDDVACCPVCRSPIETYRKVWVRDDSKRGGHYEDWQTGGCYPSKRRVQA